MNKKSNIERVVTTAATRAATNTLSRFFTRLLNPPKAPVRSMPPTGAIPATNHKWPTSPQRKAFTPKAAKGTFYVGLAEGYLVAITKDPFGPTEYTNTLDVRQATPFRSHGASNKHAKLGIEVLWPNDQSKHYFAIMANN